MREQGRPRVGFIGMGHMGSRMAARLLEAGYPLTVYDRTPEKVRPLGQRGAQTAARPSELAAACQVIMSSLADDTVVREVLLGPGGALEGARPGALLIDLSTVYPRTSRQVFTACREQGVAMIDAAVSGSTPQAEEGSLVILVGGEPEAYRRSRAILEVLGRMVFHMGQIGMGAMTKLVVNTLLGVGLQALAEALALGEKAGLDKGHLLDVLEETLVLSPKQKAKLGNAQRGEYPVSFALRLMHKDFGLILRLAQELVVPMPATAAAQQVCAMEQAKGIEEDYSATIRLMEELAAVREAEPTPS